MKAVDPTLVRVLGTWQLEPAVILISVAAAALYGYGVARCPRPWPKLRTASFLAGLLVLNLALSSGVDAYSEELLSVHVIQHLLLMLLAPALLLWGAPVRLALSAGSRSVRSCIGTLLHDSAVRLLTRPAAGFLLFTLVVLTTHLTGLYEVALRDPTVHALEHGAYFWSGVLLLLPLLAADPIPHPPSAMARFSWLMAAMTVMSIPAALFIFDQHVRYPFYLQPARALHRSALGDQHSAGVIMLVGGGIAMWLLAMIVAIEAMVREERRQQRRDSYLYPADQGGEPSTMLAREASGR